MPDAQCTASTTRYLAHDLLSHPQLPSRFLIIFGIFGIVIFLITYNYYLFYVSAGATPAEQSAECGLTLQAAMQPRSVSSSATAASYVSSEVIIVWIIPPCVLAG